MFEHPKVRTLPRMSPEHGGPGDGCQVVDELLEPYVDGDLEPTACRRVDRHVAACAACAEQLRIAQRVRTTLRALPPQVCPPSVDLSPPAGRLERLGTTLVSWTRWPRPPIWAATAAVALIAAVLSIGHLERSASAPAQFPIVAETEFAVPGQAKDQVARAEAEVKLALAYLGRIGSRTGNIVAQDVLEARIAGPIARTVRKALMPPAAPPPSSDEVIR